MAWILDFPEEEKTARPAAEGPPPSSAADSPRAQRAGFRRKWPVPRPDGGGLNRVAYSLPELPALIGREPTGGITAGIGKRAYSPTPAFWGGGPQNALAGVGAGANLPFRLLVYAPATGREGRRRPIPVASGVPAVSDW
jgi:hypothetical protein